MSEKVAPPDTSAGPCTEGPCSEATEHVWDYLDGELDEGDCERIKSHVEECEPCRRTYASEQKMKDAVSRACGCDSAPQDLRSKVIAMVDALRRESCRKKSES